MASSRAARSRYSNYITKKIPYIKMLNRIKIVELFKELLSIAYRGKEKKILLAKTNIISVTKRIKKSKGL